MRRGTSRVICIIALCLCPFAAAFADDPTTPDASAVPDGALHSGFAFDLGFAVGGGNLLTPAIAGGFPNYPTLPAGEGFSLGAGYAEWLRGTNLGFRQALRYTYDEDDNSDCETDDFDDEDGGDSYTSCTNATRSDKFSHLDLEAMVLTDLGARGANASWVLGAGITYVRNPSLDVEDHVSGKQLRAGFRDTYGPALELRWQGFSLRFTRLRYTPEGGGGQVDGDSLGFFYTLQF